MRQIFYKLFYKKLTLIITFWYTNQNMHLILNVAIPVGFAAKDSISLTQRALCVKLLKRRNHMVDYIECAVQIVEQLKTEIDLR